MGDGPLIQAGYRPDAADRQHSALVADGTNQQRDRWFA